MNMKYHTGEMKMKYHTVEMKMKYHKVEIKMKYYKVKMMMKYNKIAMSLVCLVVIVQITHGWETATVCHSIGNNSGLCEFMSNTQKYPSSCARCPP